MFKIGDIVNVVDDDLQGKVIEIRKNIIKIYSEATGFEHSYFEHELTMNQSIELDNIIVKDNVKPKKNPTIDEKNELKEIDLHIGHLVDFTSGLSKYEMLQIQKHRIEFEIELAIKKKRKKLIFIHGHGKGILREELYKILNQYKSKLTYYDASFKKYKLGATEVEFF